MTKAELVTEISKKAQVEATIVLPVVESFMATVKDSLSNNENVYLKGFGSFVVKHKAQKVARNIKQQTNVIIQAHNVPAFKPSDKFIVRVK